MLLKAIDHHRFYVNSYQNNMDHIYPIMISCQRIIIHPFLLRLSTNYSIVHSYTYQINNNMNEPHPHQISDQKMVSAQPIYIDPTGNMLNQPYSQHNLVPNLPNPQPYGQPYAQPYGQPYMQPYGQQPYVQPYNPGANIMILKNSNATPCAICGRQTGNIVGRHPGPVTFMWCCCLWFFTGFLCCIPFCVQSCQDIHLTCINCQMVKMIIPANCC